MSTYPLLGHGHPDAIVAFRQGNAVPVHRFLAEAAALATRFPPGGHVLNACADRYRFAVGLAAALLTNRVSLLPANLTPETIRQMRQFRPDLFCVTDADDLDMDLPQLAFRDDPGDVRPHAATPIPQIEADRAALWLFTSGSTGEPVSHLRRWGSLVRSVEIEADRFGLRRGDAHVVVATVPPQHSYGLESSVLLPMRAGIAFSGARPFYPADICAALAAVPAPRVLVSTPFHLRLLLDSGVAVPALDSVVSATAPLTPTMAREVEDRLSTRLFEIYGSTDTGQVASRRPAATVEWQVFPGVELAPEDDRTWIGGGHVGDPVALSDVVELTANGGFLLLGRSSDLVNIAGKRSSLDYLTHQLLCVPGVRDATYFMPDDRDGRHVNRLAAIVVAPGLDAADLIRELRLRIDPIFLPRPLVFAERLPRNGTGKLPRSALNRLLAGRADALAERK